jgi:ATP-dependent protease ClpP protease subunit
VKIFNFRPRKHRGAFSFKARISNLGIDTDDPDELEDLLDDADEASELDEDDPDNDGSEGEDDEGYDDGEVVDLLVYSVVGDLGSLDPSDQTNVTARAIATALRSAPNAKRINVHLNSEGGNVADALAIYNSLTAHKAQVRTFVDGVALSSASLIAMVGDSVTMRRGSLMMIHNPWSLAIGDSDTMRKQARTLDKFQSAIASGYAEKTGLSLAEIKAMMDEETWMTAMQAKRLGFADAISGRASVKQVAGTNNLKIGGIVYNLGKYKNAAAVLNLGDLPGQPEKIADSNNGKAEILDHMANVAKAALGSRGLAQRAGRPELVDRGEIHDHMAEFARSVLGTRALTPLEGYGVAKIGELQNDKEAIQSQMVATAKAVLGKR